MKLLDKLHNKIRFNKKIMIFLFIITLIGIITGSFLSVVLNSSDKKLVIDNIKDFINSINDINNIDLLKKSLIINFIIIGLIWILGISVIGLIVVICIIFWKSFTIGFTVSGFILTYNIKGALIAFIYIFPHLIINLLIILYLGSYSIKFSMLIVKCIFNKVSLDFKKLMRIYLRVLIISIIFIIFSSLFESFFTPSLLKYVAPIFIK